MKIAIFHELPYGGARRVVNDFSKELKKKHIIDEYIVDEKRDSSEKEFFTHVYFYKFRPKIWIGNNWRVRLYKDTIELFKLYLLHKKIASIIDKKNYDVVIVHPSKFTQAPFILSFLNTYKVYYAHESYRIMYEKFFRFNKSGNYLKDVYEKVTRWVKKEIDKRNLNKASVIFVNSNNTKRSIYRYYSRKSIVCYPGVDPDLFKIKKLKRDIDILFIGSTSDNRDGFFDLKNAIDLLKRKINLKIIGDKKWIDDTELISFYARSKIVFCGAQNEPFGLVPLEAIASGGLVVAINEGGYKETVTKGATYLVERKVNLIAQAIEKALRSKQSNNTRNEMLKKWDIKVRTKVLENELVSLLKSKNPKKSDR